MKKIKKECLKNMIAGPSLLESVKAKASSGVQHKNSSVGPCYNSDNEDNKQSSEHDYLVKEEINREAKHWN